MSSIGVNVEAAENNLLLFETFQLLLFLLNINIIGMSYRGARVPKTILDFHWGEGSISNEKLKNKYEVLLDA